MIEETIIFHWKVTLVHKCCEMICIFAQIGKIVFWYLLEFQYQSPVAKDLHVLLQPNHWYKDNINTCGLLWALCRFNVDTPVSFSKEDLQMMMKNHLTMQFLIQQPYTICQLPQTFSNCTALNNTVCITFSIEIFLKKFFKCCWNTKKFLWSWFFLFFGA